MRSPKISVIVPIYNAERHLRRCIDSILSQTFTDFEVLLINDGSTDDSARICDEYANLDSRIRVFHKENGGVSSARNVGLKNMSGEWVLFVDSDDYIEHDLLNKCSNILSDQNRDVDGIHFGYYSQVGTQAEKRIPCGDILMNNELLIGELIPSMWLFLYNSKILSESSIYFNNNLSYCEDLSFLFRYLLVARKIFTISDALYNYVNNDNSAMSQPISYSSIVNHIEACDDLVCFFDETKMNSLLLSSYSSYLVMGCFNRIVLSKLGFREICQLSILSINYILKHNIFSLCSLRLKIIICTGGLPYILLNKIRNELRQ